MLDALNRSFGDPKNGVGSKICDLDRYFSYVFFLKVAHVVATA